MSLSRYSISIGGKVTPYFFSDSTAQLFAQLKKLKLEKAFVVYDRNLDKNTVLSWHGLIRQECDARLIGVDVSEADKTMLAVEKLSQKLISLGCRRNSTLIAIGGGVLGNTVGLLSALLFRGVKLVHLPTTTIAAFDSVLSNKQTVNSVYGKNMLGTFYQPEMILTDYAFFKTLSPEDNNGGLVELVKNLLVIIPSEIESISKYFNPQVKYEASQFELFLRSSVLAKNTVLRNDFREAKKGLVLEYGHTVGHAVEFVSSGSVKHGTAVAYGMLVAAEVSRIMGYLSETDKQTHYELLESIGIFKYFTDLPRCSAKTLVNTALFDNKRASQPKTVFPMILLKCLGNNLRREGSVLYPVPIKILTTAILNVNREIGRLI